MTETFPDSNIQSDVENKSTTPDEASKESIHDALKARSPALHALEEKTIQLDEIKLSKDILSRYMTDLNQTVKHDETTKRVIFLTALSALSRSPLNLFLKGVSSIGKTHNVIQATKYFPQEKIMYLGGLSPTALVHDYGHLVDEATGLEWDPYEEKPDKQDFKDGSGKIDREGYKKARKEWDDKIKRSNYIVSMDGVLLVLLESPNPETYNKLRPILSHDVREISYKFTDRPGGGSLRTMHVKIRGWPATIFCTTDEKYMEDLSTRSFTHTPEMSREKYQSAVNLTGAKGALPWEFDKDSEEYKALKQYMVQLTELLRTQNSVAIPYARELAEKFDAQLPRDMRDYKHLQTLIEVSTLLHAFNRAVIEVGGKRWALSNINDLENALVIYRSVEATTRAGLPGHVIQFFTNIISPLWEMVNKDPDHEGQTGILYADLARHYNQQGLNRVSTKRVSDYVDLLREIGWVDTEKFEEDRRKNLVTVIKNPSNRPISSTGIIKGLFQEEDYYKWLEESKKHSSGKITLYKSITSDNPLTDDSIMSLFLGEYLYTPNNNLGWERNLINGLIVPPEDSGRFQ